MCNLASLISMEKSHFYRTALYWNANSLKGVNCYLLPAIVKIFESLIQLGSVIICAVLCTFWQSFRCKEDPALMKLGVNFSLQKCKMRHEKHWGSRRLASPIGGSGGVACVMRWLYFELFAFWHCCRHYRCTPLLILLQLLTFGFQRCNILNPQATQGGLRTQFSTRM